MFERYTESARRVLFFSRLEASEKGSRTIDTEHLLLGLIREEKGLVRRVLRESNVAAETLRHECERRATFQEKISTSVEIPFSEPAKAVMLYTAEEADRLRDTQIGPEHLLVALARVEGAVAGSILAGQGLSADALREIVLRVRAAPVPVAAEARAEAANLADRIKQWVDELARAEGGQEAEALAQRIQAAVDALKRLLGD